MIYVDGDGVLFDFHTKYFEMLGKSEVMKNYPRGKPLWEAAQIDQVEMFKSFNRAGEDFWQNLPLLPDAKELWEFLQETGHPVKILTTVIRNKKAIWWREALIKKHFGADFKDFIIQEKKEIYASPKALLIDDREEVVEPFIKAGGKGYVWPQPWNLQEHIDLTARKRRIATILRTM